MLAIKVENKTKQTSASKSMCAAKWVEPCGGWSSRSSGVSCYYLLAAGGGYILTIQHSINPDLPLVELLTSDQNEASLVNIESLILHNYIEMLPHTLSASKNML